jgi:hypothetical protein
MKNILVKSALVFIFMTIINFVLSILILYLPNIHSGSFGMHPFLILIECCFVSVIAFITVIIFKKNYQSVLRIAILYVVIYLVVLILSGFNPFGEKEKRTFSLLIYINSGITFFIVYLLILLYSKIILSTSKK